MGVKSSGELSFTNDIVGEYGTAPHSFSEYKRGGVVRHTAKQRHTVNQQQHQLF